MNIGNVNIPSPIVLAPMAGVTDAAFRHVCRMAGAGLLYTEMVSAKALCYGDAKTKALLRSIPGDRPLSDTRDKLEKMYEARIAIYRETADVIVPDMATPQAEAEFIKTEREKR